MIIDLLMNVKLFSLIPISVDTMMIIQILQKYMIYNYSSMP